MGNLYCILYLFWRACNLTSFIHSSTGPMVKLFASRHEGPRFNPQGGVLIWNWDSPASVVSLQCWPQHDWSLWPRLRWASSRTIIRPFYRQCNNPSWSHTALLSMLHARCRSSLWLHNQHSRLLGGTGGPVVHPFASRREGPRFNPQGGIYVKPGFSC
jgi:hypothetical protein